MESRVKSKHLVFFPDPSLRPTLLHSLDDHVLIVNEIFSRFTSTLRSRPPLEIEGAFNLLIALIFSSTSEESSQTQLLSKISASVGKEGSTEKVAVRYRM